MRGDAYLSAAPVASSDEPVAASTAQGPAAGVSNIQENMQAANKPGSVVWLLLLGVLVAVYYYFYNKNWKEAISADGILAFLHQSFMTTLLVVVGINMANVFLTKLAAMKIPGISKAAGTFLPLFHL
jgi:hypothetical protein